MTCSCQALRLEYGYEEEVGGTEGASKGVSCQVGEEVRVRVVGECRVQVLLEEEGV